MSSRPCKGLRGPMSGGAKRIVKIIDVKMDDIEQMRLSKNLTPLQHMISEVNRRNLD